MRVAMVSRFPRDFGKPRGGVESATVNLASGMLARSDVDLTLVTLEREVDDLVIENVGGVTVHRLPRSSWCPMMFDVLFGPSSKRLNAHLAELAPDIVHYQETWGLGGSRQPLPRVMTVHGFDSLNLPTENADGPKWRPWLWHHVERYGLNRQANIISIAPYVTEQMGEVPGEVIDIPNAISPEIFKIPTDPQPGRLFYAGWLDRRKNLIALLQVLVELKQTHGLDVTLRAAGASSDPEYKREIDAFIAANDLQGNVELLGQVDQATIRAELSQADALGLLSLQENAPMIISEAMALGVPVVCSDLCGMVDMVANDERGYRVEPDDITGAARHFANIISDRGLRARLSTAAIDYANRMYHPDSVAQATMDCYHKVLQTG